MAVTNSKLGRFGLFLANPMVAKMDKVEESGEPSATVGGIAGKTVFFLLLTLVGVTLFFVTNGFVSTEYVETIEGYSVNLIEAGIAFGSLFLGIIGTFICFKFVRASFLFGSIYSLSQGYSLALLFHIFGSDYIFPGLLVLGITVLLVLSMLLLYRLHLVSVTKKFVSVLVTLIFVGILLALGVYVMEMFPATKTYADFIINNKAIVIGCAAFGIVVATLFLLVDFEVIDHSVEAHLPKKYEWLGAFALSFSIIELYLKIFNFLFQSMSNNSSN